MGWNRRYALASYTRSSLWIAPLIAFVASQVLFRVSTALDIDFGFIPGFAFSRDEAQQSAMDIDITMNLSFIVFTFGSMLVAIQVASGQLTPRVIACCVTMSSAGPSACSPLGCCWPSARASGWTRSRTSSSAWRRSRASSRR